MSAGRILHWHRSKLEALFGLSPLPFMRSPGSLCTTPTSRVEGSAPERGYRAFCCPLRPGLCRILNMDFREFLF
jgi:hypothetical protein